jgi:hypothetical protein
MRMETTQTSKSLSPGASAFQIREHEPARIANNNVFDISVAIHKNAYLAIDLSGYLSKLSGKILRDDLSRRDPPLIELF